MLLHSRAVRWGMGTDGEKGGVGSWSAAGYRQASQIQGDGELRRIFRGVVAAGATGSELVRCTRGSPRRREMQGAQYLEATAGCGSFPRALPVTSPAPLLLLKDFAAGYLLWIHHLAVWM